MGLVSYDVLFKNLMKTKILLSLTIIGLSSCSSIVSKSDYPVSFTSPKPVSIKIQSKDSGKIVYQGQTPTVTTLSASDGFFKPAKYDVITSRGSQPLNATMDGWYAGNILFGGIIGALIVDPATGAMWKLPKEVPVSLTE